MNSTRVADLTFANGPGSKSRVLSPAIGWESTVVQEPSVWFYGGLWHMIYTAGPSGAHRLGYASASSPTGPWTRNATAVIGGGTVLAGGAYHANVYREGSTLWCHFVDDTDNTLLKVATADVATPTVWTLNARTYALPAGSNLWGNVGIFKDDDGTYYMLAETSKVDGTSWQLSVATLAGGPAAALTWGLLAIPSLRPSAINSNATTSGAQLFKEDGRYVLYYHCGVAGSLPTDIYRATTDVLTTDSWTIDRGARPIIARNHRDEVDQAADVFLCQGPDGDWWAFWTGMDNSAPRARILATVGIPTLMRRSGSKWVPSNVGGIGPDIQTPQATLVASLSADFTTASTSFVDVPVMSKRFIARSTRALVRLAGSISNTTGGAATKFRVTDGGSVVKPLGSVAQPAASGGYQTAVNGAALLTGLTPGQRYVLKLQAKVSSGTLQIRVASLNAGDDEHLVFSIEDVQVPDVTG